MQYHHNNNHHLHCSGCFPGYRIDSSHFCLNKCFGDKWHQMFWGQVIPVLYGLDALLVTQATASRCWRKLSNTDQHQEKLPALYLCSSNTRLPKKRCCSLHTCFLTPLCQSLYIFGNYGSLCRKNWKMASRSVMSIGVYIAWPQQTRTGFVRCRSMLSNRSLAIKCFSLLIVQNDPPSSAQQPTCDDHALGRGQAGRPVRRMAKL